MADAEGVDQNSHSNHLAVHQREGTWVGRIWDPAVGGPSVVHIRQGRVVDVSGTFATMSALTQSDSPVARVAAARGVDVGSLEEVHANSIALDRDDSRPWLLAPVDLHAVKAAGVTFAVSMLERVIEERARGQYELATEIRRDILEHVGGDLKNLAPGSADAQKLKDYLIEKGMWSQYLEVGIGPDAEIFTKAQPLSAMGFGADIGVLATSTWNNPEPEVALLVTSRGEIIGATLGNDVNLRDVEGRSALLLPKAKDNNASCALGPFIRLFDETFTLDSVREMQVTLQIEGDDGFESTAVSDMQQISRDPADLVKQLIGPHHQYPDGAALMLGTLFAPSDDRGEPGKGFTHEVGDRVRISSDELGTLFNVVRHSESCAPWEFGIGSLMTNLAQRGLI